ncbi:mechanosensitive ion channel domain-containing protein [Fulvivirga sedimenti]|uniref:Mechanosensitive ion channel family protein n=1 Tax=Fulvivirga sedimenti TaxID=2879465 RepID=A0A9X1HVM7_9BACT|nr:mechanosensitive ion channel domain-containing protein [Fulvivirga sedimenti]MCA6078711.1 mechanosensitive ion channel family protein [Fulvivirga sedimenti]
MDIIEIKLIETAVVVVAFVLLRLLFEKSINRIAESSSMKSARRKVTRKVVNTLLILLAITLILIIWGVDQSKLAVFVGSVFTVVGIAMFAQWSILSNITAGILIFFNHSIKLDETIRIMDKDYEIEGRVSDIGLFFLILKTPDKEEISIPNSVFFQKMIRKKTSA